MCDTKPCSPVPNHTPLSGAKKSCEPEEKRKCKVPPPPPSAPLNTATPPAPDCVEPVPPEVVNKVLFEPASNDPVDQERIKCLNDCHVEPIYNLLKECNKRVTRKILYTAETCHEETVDLMEALDKCVKSKAFKRLA